MRTGPTVLALALAATALVAHADAPPPDGLELAQRVNARDTGAAVARTLVMDLIEKDGSTRTRVTRSYRRRFGDEKRAVLFFEDPSNVKGTALLTWDYADPKREDDQWLYLPALRKSRRVALADRGRAFLGTDLSFEDMKKETEFGIDDYRWQTVGEESVDGHRCWVVDATPVDERTGRELGYGRVRVRIDAEIWVPRLAEYWAPDGAALKTVRLLDIEPVQGIWTVQRIEAENLRTGHRTTLRFRDVNYHADVPEDLFTEGALRRGVP